MSTHAIVLEQPHRLALRPVEVNARGPRDVVVDVEWSGISTGTERLLWDGRMPDFPGMGYPLVPGYETVGRISAAGSEAQHRLGERVFIPGASCFSNVRCLFGGAAEQLVVPEERAIAIADELGERATLLALAATANHALATADQPPELIVGHGALGRLLARLTLCAGHPAPVVWERDAGRRAGALGYEVVDPDDDPRCDYRAIYDVSGDGSQLDTLIGRLAARGEVVLAGFYSQPLQFSFPPAFMREARLHVAAEWAAADLQAVAALANDGRLSLADLITHRLPISEAQAAYETAFADTRCLKMILDWRAD